jgi:hypothetical protein
MGQGFGQILLRTGQNLEFISRESKAFGSENGFAIYHHGIVGNDPADKSAGNQSGGSRATAINRGPPSRECLSSAATLASEGRRLRVRLAARTQLAMVAAVRSPERRGSTKPPVRLRQLERRIDREAPGIKVTVTLISAALRLKFGSLLAMYRSSRCGFKPASCQRLHREMVGAVVSSFCYRWVAVPLGCTSTTYATLRSGRQE